MAFLQNGPETIRGAIGMNAALEGATRTWGESAARLNCISAAKVLD